MAKSCCNRKHPEPVPATHVLVDRQNRPNFLCDACAYILDDLGNLDIFIQELADWEQEQLTPEEHKIRDWLDYGDQVYHQMKDEGRL